MVTLDSAHIAVESLGPFGPAAFVIFCMVTTLFFIPVPILYLAAGALFGIPVGLALVSVSSLVNITALFLTGRYLSRKWVVKKIALHAKVKAIDDAVTDYGWKMVLLLRLTVVLPFSLMNYALGLANIPFKDYLLASWVGMMPAMLLYLYMGTLAGEVVLGAGPRQRTPAEWAFFALGLLVTIGMGIYATGIIRKVLRHEGLPFRARL